MHFITGGAHNGKADWVRKFYQEQQSITWIASCKWEDGLYELPEDVVGVLVLEGVEQLIAELLETSDKLDLRAQGYELLHKWQEWESEIEERKLVVIGTDISKGIVPMEKKMREWRDVTGWFYQDLVATSERVDLIWYGISKRLK